MITRHHSSLNSSEALNERSNSSTDLVIDHLPAHQSSARSREVGFFEMVMEQLLGMLTEIFFKIAMWRGGSPTTFAFYPASVCLGSAVAKPGALVSACRITHRVA